MIFGRNSKRPLTQYKQQINEASIELCLHNSKLLCDRQSLLESCRKRVNGSGYVYKKGKSRSHKFNPASPAKKRKKISQDFRIQRLTELQERIKELPDQIGYKEKRVDQVIISNSVMSCPSRFLL